MVKAAKELVKAMLEAKVNHVFGIPGGAILTVYDALYDVSDKIEVILFRHEQGAIHAADAYARVLRRPGVTIVTSGPGATNLFTGLANAYMDSSPVVAITGQVPTIMFGKDAFQETDMIGSTMTVTKFNILVRDAKKLAPAFKTAYKISIHGRPGPVLIDVPRDVQDRDVPEWNGEELEIPGLYKNIPEPDLTLVSMAIKLLLEAERPVILVGGGVYWSNATDEVLKLAEMLQIPIVTTLPGKNAVPNNHPLVMGPVGMHGRLEADAALANSDLVLALGTRFSDRTICNFKEFQKDRKIIHIDIDKSEIGKNVKPTIGIVSDVKKTLQLMLKLIPKAMVKNERFLNWLRNIRETFEKHVDKLGNKVPGFAPWKVLKTIRQVVPLDIIVTTGVGSHQMWCEIHWQVCMPGTFITSAGLGTMGFGLPAAIGAAFARPGKPVLDIDGDGSFLMTMQNLAVVREHDLPIIVVIFNNTALGLVKQWQTYIYSKRVIASEFRRNPDFTKLANAFNIEGVRPESYEELKISIEKAIRSREPIVIDVTLNTEYDVVVPWVKPGQWLIEAQQPTGLHINLTYS